VDIRSHCYVTETWEQLRRLRSINLDVALNELQLMKIIKLLHVSAQVAILSEFLKKFLKEEMRYRDM